MGQPIKEYQEHEGAKDASTLYVGYNYDTSSSTADAMNRVDAIKDDSGGLFLERIFLSERKAIVRRCESL